MAFTNGLGMECLILLFLCISCSTAKMCGETKCNEAIGGYCCGSKTGPENCCCIGYPVIDSFACNHSPGSSTGVTIPTWAGILIVLAIIGIISGGIVGIYYFITQTSTFTVFDTVMTSKVS